MVLDNHPCHKSRRIKNLAHKMGIELLFMPPTASELNPVEKMWGYFKREWRKRLYNPQFTITNQNSRSHIIETLELVKFKGNNLTKGPMNHMIRWCKP